MLHLDVCYCLDIFYKITFDMIGNWFKKNKIQSIFILLVVVCLAGGGTLYVIFGHRLINAAYKGESLEFLNNIIIGQSTHSLEYYQRTTDRFFLKGALYFLFASFFTFITILILLGVIKKSTRFSRYRFLFAVLLAIALQGFTLTAYGAKIFSYGMRLPGEKWGDFYNKWVPFISTTTPKDSLLVLPPFDECYTLDLCRYFNFPRRIAREDENSELISRHKGPIYRVKIKNSDSGERGEYKKEYVLDENFSLLLIKEREEETNALYLKDFTKIKPDFLNVTLALLKLMLIFTSGAYFVHRYFDEQSLTGFITASFLTGTIISTFFYIITSLTGLNFTEHLQFLALGVCSLPGLILLVKKNAFAKYFKNTYSYNAEVLIVVILFFLLFFVKHISTPIMEYDACSIWGTKAKCVFALHNLNWWAPWPHYPPLLSVVVSQLAIGGEKMAKLVVPLLTLCLYVNMRDEIGRTKFSGELKMLLPILLFGSVLFFRHSLIGQANFALVVFTTKAVSLMLKSLKKNSKKAWIALSIISCGVILVRPDGIIYFFTISAIACLGIFVNKYSLKNLLYLLLPLSLAFLWGLYVKNVLGKGLFVGHKIADFQFFRGLFVNFSWVNFKAVCVNFVSYAMNPYFFGVIPASFLLLCLFRWRNMIKDHFFECLFIFVAMAWLYTLSLLLAPFWGFRLYFAGGFIRFYMPVISIMFIVLLKETDKLTE